jgi:DHA1 family inner membrane transport protein
VTKLSTADASVYSNDLIQEKLIVALLAAIQFAHILDFVVLMPLGPVLMRTFSVSPSQYSLLVSSYTISAGIANFVFALYSDYLNRKTSLLICFAGFIIGTFLCARAFSYESLLWARIIAGAFGGLTNALVFALIADLIPPERRGWATGVVMSSFSMTSVLGIPLSMWLAEMFQWQAPFYLIVVLSLIFLVFVYVKLPTPKVYEQAATSVKETLKHFGKVATFPIHVAGFSMTACLAFSIFLIVPFIAPSLVKNAGLAETQIKYMYLLGGCLTIFVSRLVGRLCDRYGAFPLFLISCLFSLLAIVIMTHLNQAPVIVSLLVGAFFMMMASARFIPAMTLISLSINPVYRGTFMGLENAFRGLMSGASSYVAGLIVFEGLSGRLENFHFVGYLSILMTLLSIFFSLSLRKKLRT